MLGEPSTGERERNRDEGCIVKETKSQGDESLKKKKG